MASGEDRAPTNVSNNTDQALEEDSSQEQQALQEQDSAGGSSRVKTEPEEVTASQDPHEHGFAVKSGDTYDIDCEQPCTVLEALKTLNKYKKMFTDPQQNVIIQRGTGDDESIVPTHFPCSCIRDGEVLTISVTKLQVEKATDVRNVHPTDYYSVFYIDTKGGLNVTSTKLFRNTKVENFKYLCVYGEKEMSVEEALKRDGRFIDELGCFELMNINDEHKIVCTQKIKKLHNKKFKICRPQKANAETQDVNQVAIPGQQKLQNPPHASNNAERTRETRSVLTLAQQKGISITTAAKETNSSIDPKEVYELLCEQFPRLKQWMESRFPENSFQKTLKLRKGNFGKIQQSFSEIHQVRLLLELSESVCLLEVPIKDPFIMQGTGFVLFDNFVLTNAHLFKYWVDSNLPDWHETLNVTAVFNFETQEFEEINKINAKVFVGKVELDYVILKLDTESQVPPGLLKRFGPVPIDGAACVVGHPGRGVKKMDPTCIIVKEEREEAVNKNLDNIKEYIPLYAINQAIKNHPYKNTYVTYNSFMYHGSSGSPVFDAYGQVFGLHSGGFFYGFPKTEQSVIEFSFPLLTIFENFVDNLKKEGDENLLARVEEEAKGNPHLENRFKSVVGPKQGSPEGHLQEVQGNTAASEEPMQITA